MTDISIIFVDSIVEYDQENWRGRLSAELPTRLVGMLSLGSRGRVYVVSRDIEIDQNIREAIAYGSKVHDPLAGLEGHPEPEVTVFGGNERGTYYFIDVAIRGKT